MTLIIATGLPSCAILVADRLISAREPIDEEFEKTAEVRCTDARFGMAFTGVAAKTSVFAPRPINDLPHMPLPAKLYRFNAGDWMIRAMGRAANHESALEGVLTRFAEAATEQWAQLPRLYEIRKEDSAIAFVIVGFRYGTPDKADPVPFSALVSNFEDDPRIVQDEFWCGLQTDQLYTAVAGMHWAVPEVMLDDLDRAVESMSPPHTILAKAIRAIRGASRTKAGNARIGGQCSSLMVPADSRQPVTAEYHTEKARHVLPRPPIVDAQRGHLAAVQTNLRMWVNPEDAPIVGPKSRRDGPCWCGSGRRFSSVTGARRKPLGLDRSARSGGAGRASRALSRSPSLRPASSPSFGLVNRNRKVHRFQEANSAPVGLGRDADSGRRP